MLVYEGNNLLLPQLNLTIFIWDVILSLRSLFRWSSVDRTSHFEYVNKNYMVQVWNLPNDRLSSNWYIHCWKFFRPYKTWNWNKLSSPNAFFFSSADEYRVSNQQTAPNSINDCDIFVFRLMIPSAFRSKIWGSRRKPRWVVSWDYFSSLSISHIMVVVQWWNSQSHSNTTNTESSFLSILRLWKFKKNQRTTLCLNRTYLFPDDC